MTPIRIRPVALAAGFAALTLVAACSSPEPVNTTVDETDINIVDTSNAFIDNVVEPTPEPTPVPTATLADPTADLTTTEDTLDDAAATGMTSRLPPVNMSQPAEKKAQ